jgi:hypothetical protein
MSIITCFTESPLIVPAVFGHHLHGVFFPSLLATLDFHLAWNEMPRKLGQHSSEVISRDNQITRAVT